jgi:hypothetical protein
MFDVHRRLVALLILAGCEPSVPPTVEQARLEQTVRFLAADAMKGRGPGAPENRQAAEWILARLQEYGLETQTHEFDFNLEAGKPVKGLNVMGLLPGADPKRKDEIVVVCAHHDHLGAKGETVYNGADDNASGVAVLLEVARVASLRRAMFPRSILFISFDLEERGMVGSTKFVMSGPIDMNRVAALICMDLVGGSFYRTQERCLFALGSEYSPEIAGAVVPNPPVESLDVVPVGIFVMEPMGPNFGRSDYLAFRRRNIPFVFLSTGTPWYYHTPSDDPERIDFPKLHRVARYVGHLTTHLSMIARPTFVANPPPTVADALVMLQRLDDELSGRAELPLDDSTRKKLVAFQTKIQSAVASGKVDDGAKAAMQGAMVTVFQLVAKSREK